MYPKTDCMVYTIWCISLARYLSKFIHSAYTNLTSEIIEKGVFLRSERSCRRDLKWGTKFEFNKKRPYLEGHVWPDVLEYRKNFIECFDIKIKDFGYIKKKDKNDNKTFLEKSIIRHEDQKKGFNSSRSIYLSNG